MKKVLLTGGHGFIGSRFIKAYKHKFEILSPGSNELNVMDNEKITEIFQSFKPDFVIHAAAIALTDYCNNNPEKCHTINVNGAVNIARACTDSGARMIFLSTEQVFNGNRESGPYNENDIPVPDTMYGKNKLEAEEKIKLIIGDLLILRFTWMFGIPGRLLPVVNNILWDTIKSIMKDETITATVNEFRGITYVNDLIDQFHLIMKLPPGVYHIGSTNPLNRYETVCLILKEMGLERRIPQFVIQDRVKYKKQPRDVRLNTSLIQSLGIKFSETPDAIRRCIKEYSYYIE